MRRLLAALALLIAVSPAPTFAQIGDEVLPPPFVETFLDLPDDAAQAPSPASACCSTSASRAVRTARS
jgi:hypothetical protein